MKFKCIKDFWMERESEKYGDVPAFKAGEVYDFYVTFLGEYYTSRDNHRASHYMYNDATFYEYFIQVKE
jgi:hypothetical protein